MNSIIHPDYSTGSFSFYNVDNMEIMKCYPDKFFNLCIIDPPYGININVSMGRRKGDKKSNYHKFSGNDSSIPDKLFFDELFRISENQIIWGGNYMTEYLKPSSCWIIWDKMFSEDVTFAQFEMAWTSFNTSSKKFVKSTNQNDRIHPTQKPVALYSWLIQKYAKQGDKILDTHLGSGSIALAIDKANKLDGMDLSFVGIELDKDYFDAAINRFKDNSRQTAFNFE